MQKKSSIKHKKILIYNIYNLFLYDKSRYVFKCSKKFDVINEWPLIVYHVYWYFNPLVKGQLSKLFQFLKFKIVGINIPSQIFYFGDVLVFRDFVFTTQTSWWSRRSSAPPTPRSRGTRPWRRINFV